ncbi:hypothetical protein D3C85_989500 [compost metagenome]
MSREASFQELLGASFEYHTENFYTCIPAVVVTVRDNFNQLSIDAQPSINIKSRDGSIKERAVILNVPVQMPSSSTAAVIVPLNVGDPVMLIFSMRGLDTWKRGNGRPTTPSDYRKFDKRDAIAIPGVMPFGNSTNDPAKHVWTHNPKDLTIVQNLGSGQEVEIRLKTDGSVAINTTQKVEIQCDQAIVNANTSIELNSPAISFNGNVTHVGNYDMTGTFTLNGVNVNTHIHNGDSGGVTGGPHN